MRILIASAALAALAVPAQAGSSSKCHFSFWTVTQCAANVVVHGSKNKARIDQNQYGFGLFQFALQFQKGDGNNAYTGQSGNNEVALTFQNGNNNTAYTSQEGTNKASFTVQSGNGLWGATSSGGNNTITGVIQSN